MMMTAPAAADCKPGFMEWSETRLFFGRDIGDVGEVSDEQWRRFTIDEIIPRFSDGFTVLDASGYWRGEGCEPKDVALSGGCEKTRVLLVHYAPSPEADAKLKAITQAYINHFDQEAVMRSDTPVCTQFITPE